MKYNTQVLKWLSVFSIALLSMAVSGLLLMHTDLAIRGGGWLAMAVLNGLLFGLAVWRGSGWRYLVVVVALVLSSLGSIVTFGILKDIALLRAIECSTGDERRSEFTIANYTFVQQVTPRAVSRGATEMIATFSASNSWYRICVFKSPESVWAEMRD